MIVSGPWVLNHRCNHQQPSCFHCCANMAVVVCLSGSAFCVCSVPTNRHIHTHHNIAISHLQIATHIATMACRRNAAVLLCVLAMAVTRHAAAGKSGCCRPTGQTHSHIPHRKLWPDDTRQAGLDAKLFSPSHRPTLCHARYVPSVVPLTRHNNKKPRNPHTAQQCCNACVADQTCAAGVIVKTGEGASDFTCALYGGVTSIGATETVNAWDYSYYSFFGMQATNLQVILPSAHAPQ